MKRSKEKKLIALVIMIMSLLVVVLVIAVASLAGKYSAAWKEEQKSPELAPATETPMPTETPVPTATPTPTLSPTPTPTPEPTATPVPEEKYPGMDPYLAVRLQEVAEKENIGALLGTAYDDMGTLTGKSMSCIVEKDGKWGMVSVTGEVLVPLKYERYSFKDNTGWAEFEQNGYFYVYDEQGKLIRLYSDKTAYRMQSEDGHLFRTAKSYMSGMEITLIIPEMKEEDYYGVEYRSRETGELLYRAVGGYDDVGMFTYPDETGRAIAIRGNGSTNTIYSITAEGCESRTMELPEGVIARRFDFVGNYTWADISLSRGWVKVFVADVKQSFLTQRQQNYYAFLNVNTLELVPFPEEYQGYFTVYNKGYGDTMAIRVNTEDDSKKLYALCKGNRKLTEELYTGVRFDEQYIFAYYKSTGVDVLDYEGNVVASYSDSNGTFFNGRLLVLDEAGLYFVDENFEQCSEFLLPGIEVDSCLARGVYVDGKYYFLPEIAMEELPKTSVTEQPQLTEVPMPTDVPVKLVETEYEITEFKYEVYRYLGDVYIIRNGKYFGMADTQGNILVEPGYEQWVYEDQDWVSFEDSGLVTHVFDRSTGKELYTYNYYAGTMTTESGQQFDRTVFYRQGMRIEFDSNKPDFYYGIHYYNAETGALIFELTDEMCLTEENPKPDFQIATMPDATGTAVVIGGSGFYNTMYQITKDGYTEETYREEFLERRFFYFSDHSVWNRTNLYDGWLITTICEERGDLLDYTVEWMDILYNVHTKERLILPDDYQEWRGEFYQHSAGVYYGISGESSYDKAMGETEYLYYAICRGNEVLTPELYQWIRFDETYIIAGNNSFSHVLDYDGNVLAEYKDVAYPFVDGKTLVCDDTGVFYIDETLSRCSDYLMTGVDYCHPGFVCKGDKCYLIHQKNTED